MSGRPDPDDFAGITIPDDASSLEADRWRYYRELDARGQLRHTPDQPADTDHPSRWRDGLPWFGHRGSKLIPLGFIVAAVLAMVGSLLLATVSRVDAPLATAPLAVGTADVGVVGGLLPSAPVAVNGAPRLLRDIRPAVIALVPQGECPECQTGVANAAAAAEAARMRFIVGSEGSDPTSAESYAAPVGAATLLAPVGTFADYRPRGLTLFSVAPDGVVADVIRDADANAAVTTFEPAT